MIYWRDVPGDISYESPITPHHGGHHSAYVAFQYDQGGWNNIRMGIEIMLVAAHAMGRTLVVTKNTPPLCAEAQFRLSLCLCCCHYRSLLLRHASLAASSPRARCRSLSLALYPFSINARWPAGGVVFVPPPQVPPVQHLYLLGKPTVDPATGKKKNRALGFEDFFDLARLQTHQVYCTERGATLHTRTLPAQQPQRGR